MGMVMVVEGLPYFAFPERMKAVISSVLDLPDWVLRRFGLMLMAAGVGVVYFGKSVL